MIATGTQREALIVSKDAVLVRPDGATVWVAVRRGEGRATEVQPVPVTINVRMPRECAVNPQTDRGCKLLVPGAQVVVEGAERLMPGQEVDIVTLDDDPDDVVGPEGSKKPNVPAKPATSVDSASAGGQES